VREMRRSRGCERERGSSRMKSTPRSFLKLPNDRCQVVERRSLVCGTINIHVERSTRWRWLALPGTSGTRVPLGLAEWETIRLSLSGSW